MPSFYEFFSGGGMARAGLGPGWTCLFANDNDPKKVSAYKRNWGDKEISDMSVDLLSTRDIPGTADLAWASFPCQDLSLAGLGAGLKGSRSGTFWPFWRLIQALRVELRQPSTVVLENVCGALTSHDGDDFRSIIEALCAAGYRSGALVIDAERFLPHSRPRLFVIGVREDIEIGDALVSNEPQVPFHTLALRSAYGSLTRVAKAAWIWWRLPVPPLRRQRFSDIIEETPTGVCWHSHAETERLLSLMSPINLSKVEKARRMKRLMVGSLYKRTRPDDTGMRAQRAKFGLTMSPDVYERRMADPAARR
jgi:DNA (cytosine-5)-methyltransferase 1